MRAMTAHCWRTVLWAIALMWICGGCGNGSTTGETEGKHNMGPPQIEGPPIGLDNDTPSPCEHARAQLIKSETDVMFIIHCTTRDRLKPVGVDVSVQRHPEVGLISVKSFGHQLEVRGSGATRLSAGCARDGLLVSCGARIDGRASLVGVLHLGERDPCRFYVSIVSVIGSHCAECLDLRLRRIFLGRPRGC